MMTTITPPDRNGADSDQSRRNAANRRVGWLLAAVALGVFLVTLYSRL
jgi:hypothetical protein